MVIGAWTKRKKRVSGRQRRSYRPRSNPCSNSSSSRCNGCSRFMQEQDREGGVQWQGPMLTMGWRMT